MKAFVIALCLISLTPLVTHAATTLNARILPTLWYSSLSAEEGDIVHIYAGIQNDSGTEFKGAVVFYANTVALGSVPFISKSGSVERVGIDWKAPVGKTTLTAALTTDLDGSKVLVSTESEKSSYSIEKKITLETVTNTIKEAASEVVSNASVKLDKVAVDLGAQLETLRMPANTTPVNTANVNQKGKVLGTSTISDVVSVQNMNQAVHGAANSGITALQYVLAHWRLSALGLVVLSLLFVFLKR